MMNNYLMGAMMMAIVEAVMNNNANNEGNPFTDLVNALGKGVMAEGRETSPCERDLLHFGGIALGQMQEAKRKDPQMSKWEAQKMIAEMANKWAEASKPKPKTPQEEMAEALRGIFGGMI